MRLSAHALACASCLLLSACEVVPPGDDAGTGGSGGGKVPGVAFSENVCFRCSLRSCANAVNACNLDAVCSPWLRCVAACPTDQSGVAAEGSCLIPCGLPVWAEVLYQCIQDYSTGLLAGCGQDCTPLGASDAGSD